MSKKQPILTRLHKAPSDARSIIDAMLAQGPLYIFDTTALELLNRIDVVACIRGLIAENACRLPHTTAIAELVIEDVSHTVLLRETARPGFFEVEYSFLSPHGFLQMPGIAEIDISGSEPASPDDPDLMFFDDGGANVEKRKIIAETAIRCMLPGDWRARKSAAPVVTIATLALVLLTATRGIEREAIVVDEKLQRAREKAGKPRIPAYTYFRLAHYYDRDGNKRALTHEIGRRMPMHIRAGYHRWQPYGPGRTERKRIFIPSCIVNFDPAGSLSERKRKVSA